MGLLSTIALVVLSISFAVFVIFFGRIPALRRTPIGALNRLLWVHIPSAIQHLDNQLTGGKVVSTLKRFANYVAFGRHPTVLIFFILLLSVGQYLYLPTAWPLMSISQRFIGSALVFFPYLFLYLSVASDPGVIKPDNLQMHLALYPYDFALFHPGQKCSTCKTLKPARSKHCSVCNRCVAKLDHHCIFINNCVGYGNQHWFLLLLFSTAVLTLYGGVLGLSQLTDRITAQLPGWSIWKPRDVPWDLWFTGWGYGLQSAVGMGSVTLLATLTSPMVWGLLAYQFYLIWCGTTTNESMKWSDWKEEMTDGCAFIRPLPADRQKNPHVEAPWTRWPLEPVQIMVRTIDGTPPDLNNPANMGLQGLGEWQRVWKLEEVENLYDLGFWDNMADVFVKNYEFGVNKQLPQCSGTKGKRKRKASRT